MHPSKYYLNPYKYYLKNLVLSFPHTLLSGDMFESLLVEYMIPLSGDCPSYQISIQIWHIKDFPYTPKSIIVVHKNWQSIVQKKLSLENSNLRRLWSRKNYFANWRRGFLKNKKELFEHWTNQEYIHVKIRWHRY